MSTSPADFLKLVTECNQRQWQHHLLRKKHSQKPQVPSLIRRAGSQTCPDKKRDSCSQQGSCLPPLRCPAGKRKEAAATCLAMPPQRPASRTHSASKQPQRNASQLRLSVAESEPPPPRKCRSAAQLKALLPGMLAVPEGKGTSASDLSVASTRAPSAASSRPCSGLRMRRRPSSEAPSTPEQRSEQSVRDFDDQQTPPPASKSHSPRTSRVSSAVDATVEERAGDDKLDLEYNELVAASKPPRPRTPGSGIGGLLRRRMPARSSSCLSDVGSVGSESSVGVQFSVADSGTVSLRFGGERGGASSSASSKCDSARSCGSSEQLGSQRSDRGRTTPSTTGTAEVGGRGRLDNCRPEQQVSPNEQASSTSDEHQVWELPLRLPHAAALGAKALDSARSDVAAKGTPTSQEVTDLNACYAEMAGGCLGQKPAEWLAEKLWDGEPPAAEEIKACMAFSAYDKDGDGRLSMLELGTLLREQGKPLDYAAAEKAMELAAGPGAKELSLEGFLQLVHQGTERSQGYSEDQQALLREVFDSYDSNGSGSLENLEASALLSDLGRAPQSREEAQELSAMLASCREAGTPGPLSFDEFLKLARRLDDGDEASTANPVVAGHEL